MLQGRPPGKSVLGTRALGWRRECANVRVLTCCRRPLGITPIPQEVFNQTQVTSIGPSTLQRGETESACSQLANDVNDARCQCRPAKLLFNHRLALPAYGATVLGVGVDGGPGPNALPCYETLQHFSSDAH